MHCSHGLASVTVMLGTLTWAVILAAQHAHTVPAVHYDAVRAGHYAHAVPAQPAA